MPNIQINPTGDDSADVQQQLLDSRKIAAGTEEIPESAVPETTTAAIAAASDAAATADSKADTAITSAAQALTNAATAQGAVDDVIAGNTQISDNALQEVSRNLTTADIAVMGLDDAIATDRRAQARSVEVSTVTTINVVDGQELYIDVDEFHGGSRLNIASTETLVGALSDVAEGDQVVTLSAGTVAVGDWVYVSGDISHDDYTPERQTDAKVVAKVIAVSGSDCTLDRQVPYNLTTCSMYKLNDCKVILKGGFNAVAVDIVNIPQIDIDCTFYGSIGDTDVGLDIDLCANLNGKLRFDNFNALIGSAFNYVSGGTVDIQSINSGSADNGAKVARGNAVSGMIVNYSGIASKYKDFGFDGCRNCEFNVKSVYGGAEYWASGATDANRLESVVIAESQDIVVNANIREANDQGLELIACTDVDVYGYVANGKNTESSEGAMIIKGESSNIRVYVTVRGYQSRGVKVECSLEAKNIRFMPTCDIYSNDNVATHVRDGVSSYDANIEVEGIHRGTTCIEIKRYTENCKVNAVCDMTSATAAGLTMQAPCKLMSVRGINTDTYKQLISTGTYCTDWNIGETYGDTDGCYVGLNGDSRTAFAFSKIKNASCDINLNGSVTSFTFVAGVPYADTTPTLGTYVAGDFYNLKASSQPTASTMVLGSKYDGSAWVELIAEF